MPPRTAGGVQRRTSPAARWPIDDETTPSQSHEHIAWHPPRITVSPPTTLQEEPPPAYQEDQTTEKTSAHDFETVRREGMRYSRLLYEAIADSLVAASMEAGLSETEAKNQFSVSVRQWVDTVNERRPSDLIGANTEHNQVELDGPPVLEPLQPQEPLTVDTQPSMQERPSTSIETGSGPVSISQLDVHLFRTDDVGTNNDANWPNAIIRANYAAMQPNVVLGAAEETQSERMRRESGEERFSLPHSEAHLPDQARTWVRGNITQRPAVDDVRATGGMSSVWRDIPNSPRSAATAISILANPALVLQAENVARQAAGVAPLPVTNGAGAHHSESDTTSGVTGGV